MSNLKKLCLISTSILISSSFSLPAFSEDIDTIPSVGSIQITNDAPLLSSGSEGIIISEGIILGPTSIPHETINNNTSTGIYISDSDFNVGTINSGTIIDTPYTIVGITVPIGTVCEMSGDGNPVNCHTITSKCPYLVPPEPVVESLLPVVSTNTNLGNLTTSLNDIYYGHSGNTEFNNMVENLALNYSYSYENAVKTLTPTTQTSGSTTQATVASQDAAINTVEHHMEFSRSEMGGGGVATGDKMKNYGVWGEVFGSAIDQGFRKGVDGYQANLGGISLGADTSVTDQAKIGASFAYSNIDATGTSNEVKVNSYQGSVYGTYDMGKLYYEGLGSFTYNSYDSTRILFDNSVASASFGGEQYSAKGTAGYNIPTSIGLKVTPFVSGQYTFLTQDEYTENGSSADLRVKSDDINILKSGLGTKLAYPVISNNITYTPHISTAWYYDFIGDASTVTSNFTSAAATSFISKGANVARNELQLGAGLDVLSNDNMTITFDYSLNAKQNFEAHTGELKIHFDL